MPKVDDESKGRDSTIIPEAIMIYRYLFDLCWQLISDSVLILTC